MTAAQNRGVQRLIELGMCRPSDIKHAEMEAKRLSSPEYSTKIRQARRSFGALGDPTRIKILLLLSEREMCVCELESAFGLPQPTVSHHLGILEQAGLLQRRKAGRWTFYSTSDPSIVGLLKKMIT